MKQFRKAIREINRTLNTLFFFHTLLNAVLFFLVVYFVLALLSLFPLLAAIPAVIYFVMQFSAKMKYNKQQLVEEKYAPLQEKLRTAADNSSEDNPIVNELQDEVIHDLKRVNVSSFLETKPLTYKLFGTIVLSFVIVLSTTLNLYIIDLPGFLAALPEKITAGDENALARKGSSQELADVNISDDIYGDSKLAVLGENQVDIRIQPANYEVNVREEGDIDPKQFDEVFPNEVFIEQASALEENIPEEQQELVKNYFNQLTQG